MKTFKQHVKEGMSPLGVGVTTSNSPEDGSIGVHNIHVPEVMQRVNAFVGSIAEREFIKPQHAVDELREKLNRIGLTVSDVTLEGEKGNVNCEVKQLVEDLVKTLMDLILMMMVYLIKKRVD